MSQIEFDVIKDSTGVANINLSPTGPTFPNGTPFLKEFLAGEIRNSEGSGITTLTESDNVTQIFNLSAARTVRLPSTGVKKGQIYTIANITNFQLTIESSAGNVIDYVNNGVCQLAPNIDDPTSQANWTLFSISDSGFYTPTTSTLTGTVTLATPNTAFYQRFNKVAQVGCVFSINASGSGAGTFRFTSPPNIRQTNFVNADFAQGFMGAAGAGFVGRIRSVNATTLLVWEGFSAGAGTGEVMVSTFTISLF